MCRSVAWQDLGEFVEIATQSFYDLVWLLIYDIYSVLFDFFSLNRAKRSYFPFSKVNDRLSLQSARIDFSHKKIFFLIFSQNSTFSNQNDQNDNFQNNNEPGDLSF